MRRLTLRQNGAIERGIGGFGTIEGNSGHSQGWHRVCLVWGRTPCSRCHLFDFKLTLVSSDPDALWGVRDYLTRSGASLSSTSRLEHASEDASDADAIVLFADDYPHEAVVSAVAGFSSRLVVIITGRSNEFDQLRARQDLRTRVIVLPRPTWGWMLLEAVRAGTSNEPGAL